MARRLLGRVEARDLTASLRPLLLLFTDGVVRVRPLLCGASYGVARPRDQFPSDRV